MTGVRCDFCGQQVRVGWWARLCALVLVRINYCEGCAPGVDELLAEQLRARARRP